MPGAFLPGPAGAAGDALRQVRGRHPVILTGASSALSDILTDVTMVDGPAGGKMAPLSLITFLALGFIRPDLDNPVLPDPLWEAYQRP